MSLRRSLTPFPKQPVEADLALAQDSIAPKNNHQQKNRRQRDLAYAKELGRILNAAQKLRERDHKGGA